MPFLPKNGVFRHVPYRTDEHSPKRKNGTITAMKDYLRNTYIRGTSLRLDDEQITDKLEKRDISLGGKTMRIGIRNEEGVIYRSIEAVGPGQIIDAIQALHDLNFKDELEHATTTINGFDAIFSK